MDIDVTEVHGILDGVESRLGPLFDAVDKRHADCLAHLERIYSLLPPGHVAMPFLKSAEYLFRS